MYKNGRASMETLCFVQRVMIAIHLLLLSKAQGVENVKSEIDHNSEASGQSGGYVRLGCVYKGSATVSQILWAKEANQVLVNLATRQNDDTSFVFDGEFKRRLIFVAGGINDGSITISRLSTSDSGTYICRFMTTSGNKEVKIDLIVLGHCDGCDGGVEPWVIAVATIVPLTALVAAVGVVYCFWFRKKGSPVTLTRQGQHSLQNAPSGTQRQRNNDRTSLPWTTELQLDHPPYGSGTETFEYYNMPEELSSHRNRMQHLDERITDSSGTSPPDQEASRHYEPLKPPAENAYDKLNHPTYMNA